MGRGTQISGRGSQLTALLVLVLLLPLGCDGDDPEPGTETVAYQSGAGTPLGSFGTGGVVVADLSSATDTATAISTGAALYVAGWDEIPGPSNSEWRIEKRHPQLATLDPTFGSSGVISSDPSTGADQLLALVQDGVYLYAVGFDTSPGDRQWRIEKRQMSDGALDSNFGIGGVITSNPSSGSDEATAVFLYGPSIYVLGMDEASGVGDSQWRIEKRQKSDGTLVTSFGTAGVVTSNPSIGPDGVSAVAWDGSSPIVAGYDSVPGNRRWRIEKRRGSDGALETGFGSSGLIVNNPSAGSDEIRGLYVYAGSLGNPSAVFVVGDDESAAVGDSQWRVEKRDLFSGSLLSGFGAGGLLLVNPSAGADELRAIGRATYPTNAICLVGCDASPNPALLDRRWRIEMRYEGTGALVTSYGQGGVVTSDPSPGDDVPLATSGGTWLAGFDMGGLGSPKARWRLEAWKQ